MKKIQILENKVRELYENANPNRDEWADWLWENHVLVVADYATKLAKRFDTNNDLARAAALLHDIADTKMKRENKYHEEESLQIAREIMKDSGFSDEDIRLVVDDAIRYHSCHNGEKPKSLEGKILSTSDSLAHLKTDFYVYAVWARGKDGDNLKDVKDWVLKKIERDFNDKIQFDKIRKEAKPDFGRIKILFSR